MGRPRVTAPPHVLLQGAAVDRFVVCCPVAQEVQLLHVGLELGLLSPGVAGGPGGRHGSARGPTAT